MDSFFSRCIDISVFLRDMDNDIVKLVAKMLSIHLFAVSFSHLDVC